MSLPLLPACVLRSLPQHVEPAACRLARQHIARITDSGDEGAGQIIESCVWIGDLPERPGFEHAWCCHGVTRSLIEPNLIAAVGNEKPPSRLFCCINRGADRTLACHVIVQPPEHPPAIFLHLAAQTRGHSSSVRWSLPPFLIFRPAAHPLAIGVQHWLAYVRQASTRF
jgi:hypothetical protein